MREEEVKVLLVEDQADFRDALRMLLEADGYTVLGVGSGEAALVAAQEFLPAVVLIDKGLPGMDGAEVTRELRAILGADLVIIAITGSGSSQALESMELAGVDFVLTKPVESERLRDFLPPLGGLPRSVG